MKSPRFTREWLLKSACGHLNPHLNETQKKKDQQLPGQPCRQVQWMWGQLVAWSLASGNYVVREYKFNPERKWRFDFALPAKMIGIEYEGINSDKSRHTTIVGFTGDTEKYNSAQALGWRVLRFTAKNYKTVLRELEKTLNL